MITMIEYAQREEKHMERIHVLGTGAGIVYNCYNTCFILENNKKYMLVDTGAGSLKY